MSQQPIVFKLTPIKAGENHSTAAQICKLMTPLPDQEYQYTCGHCDAELLSQMEPRIPEGTIFDCPDCHESSLNIAQKGQGLP